MYLFIALALRAFVVSPCPSRRSEAHTSYGQLCQHHSDMPSILGSLFCRNRSETRALGYRQSCRGPGGSRRVRPSSSGAACMRVPGLGQRPTSTTSRATFKYRPRSRAYLSTCDGLVLRTAAEGLCSVVQRALSLVAPALRCSSTLDPSSPCPSALPGTVSPFRYLADHLLFIPVPSNRGIPRSPLGTERSSLV